MSTDPFIQKTYNFKVKHVLLVDDDVALSQALKELLQAHDFIVSTCNNGVEALKLIMDLDVDIIVCDLMMPQMAGDMFYRAVERVKPHLCPRFIFVTGYENHPRFAEFLKKNGAVVLYKPVTEGKLMGTIKLIFSRTAGSSR